MTPRQSETERLGLTHSNVGDAMITLLDVAAATPADDMVSIIDAAGELLGAESARLLVADYALDTLRYLDTVENPQTAETDQEHPMPENGGSVAGLAFSRCETIVSEDRVLIPISENSERIGVLELIHPGWSEELGALADQVVRVLTLIIVSKRRYTDAVLRARRSEALSLAAEMQWDLLPPLSCSTARVSICGLLEPAYSIGGDSFDFALNSDVAEFAIIDAVGHGMPAVLISTVAISGLRNARREGHDLEDAYHRTSDAIANQFGDGAFATGQIGSLDLSTGCLTWLNCGHPLPVLVRNDSYVGELECRPSLPMGLGGQVVEVATEHLQPGDRVLFFTDGVTETRSADGSEFGLLRLVDLLVRAAHDRSAPVETLRSLSAAILAHGDIGLGDDATLVMIEYHGN